jgi:outer membrane protein assembly factor BamB
MRAAVVLLSVLVSALGLGAVDGARDAGWPQWGGPHRDFKTDGTGLAAAWPAEGPRRVWSRKLGDGYSAIVELGGRLFTMYRNDNREVVVALDGATGATLWEHAYEAPFSKDYVLEQGPGPRATPLVSGDRVFSAGATGKLRCLDATGGKLLWSHDLMEEFHGTVRPRGYACSPIAYRDTVIVMVGGKGNSVIAFDRKDGSVVWKSQDFSNSPSSPLLIQVGGQEQLVAFLWGEIVGLDPGNGALLWSHPHKTESGLNISMPVWGDDNLLFCSSAYDGGSSMLRLARSGGRTTVEEVWSHRRMRMHFGNVIRMGDRLYGSSGDFGPAPFIALDAKTGDVLWRDRQLGRSVFLTAGSRFIILDEDGNLALATPGAEGLTVHSKVQMLESISWTVPTLVGTRLYLRDRKNVMAVDLR